MEDTQIQPIISAKLIKTFDELYSLMLNSISEKYNLNKDELKTSFKLDSTKLAVELGIKKRNRRILDNNKRCMGRKFDGNQCTRSRRGDAHYCLSHEKNLPQGRIDDVSFKPKEKGKRGRKKKIHAFANDENYIATTRENFGGNIEYLVDENKNVYTYNIEKPVYVGKYDSVNNKLLVK